MTDPGDNLEFRPSEYYEEMVRDAPILSAAIENAIRNRPNTGRLIAGIARELEVETESGKSVVFFTRRGNAIGLVAVFSCDEIFLIEEKRGELRILFGKENK